MPSSARQKRGCFLGALVGLTAGIAASGISSSLLIGLAPSASRNDAGSLLPPEAPPPERRRSHCDELRARVAAGKLGDPNDAGGGAALYKRLTATEPPFWISLHNQSADLVRWSIMRYGFYYERLITEHAKEILLGGGARSGGAAAASAAAAGRGFLVDVGMNIGWFSLWARALGSRVVAFEPNPANRLRFCESLILNGWSEADFRIFGDAVGEREARLSLVLAAPGNPGAASLMEGEIVEGLRRAGVEVVDDVRVVRLDDVAQSEGWLEQGVPPIALLKVDVEGHDPQVFFGAERLIRSGLVLNIFMEYSCEERNKDDMKRVARQLESANYTLENIGIWNGAPFKGAKEKVVGGNRTGAGLEGTLASRLYSFCMSTGKKQLNLWWKLQE